jgi:hypothetical protein
MSLRKIPEAEAEERLPRKNVIMIQNAALIDSMLL